MKVRKRVTQAEIARLAGVSQRAVATVVGTGQAVSGVGKEKRERILAVANKLGYRPHRSAQLFRGVKSGLIGHVKGMALLEHKVMQTLYTGRAVSATGYTMISVDVLWERSGLDTALGYLYDSKVEGLLISESGDDTVTGSNMFHYFRDAGIPCVVMNPPFRPAHDDDYFHYVHSDNFQGMTALMRHVLDQGHKRVTMLIPDVEYFSLSERVRAYAVIMQAAGYELDIVKVPQIVQGSNLRATYTIGWQGAEMLLQRKRLPDAVCCGNDLIAQAALMRLQEAGLVIPDDIALAGFDNHPFSGFSNPTLTSVEQPVQGIAETSVKVLVDLIGGKKMTEHQGDDRALPCTLHPRASTGGRTVAEYNRLIMPDAPMGVAS